LKHLNTVSIVVKSLSLCASLALVACGGSSGGSGGTTATSSSSSSSASSVSTTAYTLADFSSDLTASIRENYLQLNTDVAALNTAASEFCTDSSSATLFDDVKQRWVAAQRSWQSVQGINFGPANDSNRRYLIAFYPIDDASLSERVASLILGSQNIAEAIPASAAELQGFPALEYVLFRENALELINVPSDNVRYCGFIEAVSQNLVSLVTPIHSEWVGSYGDNFSSVANAQTSLESWFGGITEQLQVVEDSKLRQVSAGNTDNLESPFAMVSRDNIIQNIDSLSSIYTMGDTSGLDYLLVSSDLASLSVDFSSRLSQFYTAAGSSDTTLAALSATENGVVEIDSIAEATHQVLEYFASDIADGLGIYIGFNGADGD